MKKSAIVTLTSANDTQDTQDTGCWFHILKRKLLLLKKESIIILHIDLMIILKFNN